MSEQSKTNLPWFPFFPSAWLTSDDIRFMSIAEEGAYHRLLCESWLQPDCGLPDDDAKLAVLSRMGRQWVKSAAKIRSKFTVIGERLFNDRLVEIWKQQIEKSKKASASAQRSHSARSASASRRQGERTARASSSVSLSSSEVKTENQQSADGPREATADEWANSATAMRSFFPALDDPFVIDVCFLCIREDNEVTDEQIAQAVYATYTTSQKSPGLFRTTVPNYIRARKRGVPIKPKSGMDAELERLKAIEKSDMERANGRH